MRARIGNFSDGLVRLSAQFAPLELAEMVHRLFAEFDQAVLARGLFKMDTVGSQGWFSVALFLRVSRIDEGCAHRGY